MRVIIAAAGTGGHINPGIAIANKIEKEEPGSEILFIGTKRGIENDLVPRAGYKLETIEAYGLSKKLTLTNIKHTIKTLQSVKKAKLIIEKFKPNVVIGTGGYICGPVLTAAQKLKIPTALHESNSFPGLAVKMLAKKTDLIMLGLEKAKEYLNKEKNVVVTGTPTKIQKLNLNDAEKYFLKEKLELNPEIPVVLIFGGSQGAKKINDAMIEIIKIGQLDKYQIVWAVGQKNYEEVKSELQKANIDIDKIKNAKILPYIYNMEEIMNVSDLLVCRSGAITITEITKLGKPAIFIPLPNVSQNHQEKNARVLEEIGAAKIILNNELTGNNLEQEIESIILNSELLLQMGKRANSINIDDVEEKIYKEIKKITN
ncbi:MAG: undecaprenyldiphospho-muramoylpentapeptide beta-N-acetylglucosaminyltransferase [Clostridia bacterium]|nr:undecaprenyldiphospho-muramoylpentapeptide beta-N-acetylglucosaminyltransferase [Clostridia bacterium]